MIEELRKEFEEIKNNPETEERKDIEENIDYINELINELKNKDKIKEDIKKLSYVLEDKYDLSAKISRVKLKKDIKKISEKLEKLDKIEDLIEDLKQENIVKQTNLDNISFLEEYKKINEQQLANMPQGIEGFLNKCETIFDQTHFAIKVMNDYLNAHKGGNEIFKNNIIKFLQAADKNKYGDLSGLLKTLQDIPNLQKKIDNMVSYRIKLNDLIEEIKTYKNTKSVQESIEATQELNPQQAQQVQQQPQQNNNPTRNNNVNQDTQAPVQNQQQNGRKYSITYIITRIVENGKYVAVPASTFGFNTKLKEVKTGNFKEQWIKMKSVQELGLYIFNSLEDAKSFCEINSSKQPKILCNNSTKLENTTNNTNIITRIIENGKYITLPKIIFDSKKISKQIKKIGNHEEQWIKMKSTKGIRIFDTLEEAQNCCERYLNITPEILCKYSANLELSQINNTINNNRNTNANTNNTNQNNNPTNISSTNNVQTTQEEHNKHKQSLLKSIKDKIFNRKNNNQQSSQNNQPIQNQQMMQYGPNGMPINPQYQQQPMNMQYQQPMNPQFQPQYDQFGNPIIPMMPNQQMMQYGPNGMPINPQYQQQPMNMQYQQPMNPQYQPQFDQFGNPINNTNGNRTK